MFIITKQCEKVPQPVTCTHVCLTNGLLNTYTIQKIKTKTNNTCQRLPHTDSDDRPMRHRRANSKMSSRVRWEEWKNYTQSETGMKR